MRIVGCFLEYDGKFVILLRHNHKPDGNTWGLAGGKVEENETDSQAMLRELEEETGYQATSSELERLGSYNFVSSQGNPYVFVAYRVKLEKAFDIKLESQAHSKYKWVTPKECYANENLIPGFHQLLKLVRFVEL